MFTYTLILPVWAFIVVITAALWLAATAFAATRYARAAKTALMVHRVATSTAKQQSLDLRSAVVASIAAIEEITRQRDEATRQRDAVIANYKSLESRWRSARAVTIAERARAMRFRSILAVRSSCGRIPCACGGTCTHKCHADVRQAPTMNEEIETLDP